MIDPLAWIDAEADTWSERGLKRRLVTLSGSVPGRVTLDGRSLVNFASNDYLGLANDPRVIEAAQESAAVHGWGSGASPLVSGWRAPHEALALALAEFEGVEAVALFSSGFAANLGAIGALVGPEDVVYLDRLDHACLVDGARLSRAKLRVYPHNDVNRLESILSRDRGKFRRSLIATDGVFSMDGDIAPLADLADLARRFGCIFLVDEAHGTGVFGSAGRGASEHCGVHDRVDVLVGTLSKALGSIGGFVAGSRKLVDWLINRARPLIYSTCLPSPAASAALRALEILQAEPWRRARIFELSSRLLDGIEAANRGHPGPIVRVIVGSPERALERSSLLLDRGFLVPAIRPPTVPKGTSRLRISLSASHELADIDGLIAGLTQT
jgi:8-amino-7-oxononanoate synthase